MTEATLESWDVVATYFEDISLAEGGDTAETDETGGVFDHVRSWLG